MGTYRFGRSINPRRFSGALLALTAAAAFLGGTRGTQDAVANGDTRTLSFHHVHTKETATITFKRHGSYDSQALSQLNWLLRDWRSDEPTKMDPRLFDIIWEVHRSVGSSEAVHINSAYRSPATNGMLRRRSRGVSKHSQHMNGRAMDFYLPDVDMARVRAVAMRLQAGGVGYYPSSYNAFVHLDSGSVRSWPRMTRDQLARLFPDGKTVHLPRDGKPLPGYEEARADILSRGGSVAGLGYAEAEGATGPRKSLWATLFGGDDDEDTDYYQATRGSAGRGTARPSPPVMASAYVQSSQSDDGGRYAAFMTPETAPAPQRRARGGTQVAALQASPSLASPSLASPAEPSPVSATAAIADAAEPAAAPQLALAPMPPRRPDDIVAESVVAFAPLPPSRPVELAAAGPVALGDGVPARGAAPALSPTLSPALPREKTAAGDDRAQLRALFAAVASDASPAPRAKVTTSRAQAKGEAPSGVVADPDSGLRLGFSDRPHADLGTSRFAGPAVKPLPTLR